MDQKRKTQVGWFLKFLNIDFEEAPLEERLDLVNEIHSVFEKAPHPGFSGFEPRWDRKIAQVAFLERQQIWLSLQDKLKQFLNGLFIKFKTLQQPILGEEKLSSFAKIDSVRLLDQMKRSVVSLSASYKSVNASSTSFSQSDKDIRRLTDDRCPVELEVTGIDDRTMRSVKDWCYRIDD